MSARTPFRTRAPSEHDEARNERAADFRRFNNNEAALEAEAARSVDADAERRERLARHAALIAKIEGGT